jgi:hypothetical protein
MGPCKRQRIMHFNSLCYIHLYHLMMTKIEWSKHVVISYKTI